MPLPLEYSRIYYLNHSEVEEGRFKMIESGAGWKSKRGDFVSTLGASDFTVAEWWKVARDWRLKIVLVSGAVHNFDGFPESAFQRIGEFMRQHHSISLERKETSLNGWNWGALDISNNTLSFSILGKKGFEIPMERINGFAHSSGQEIVVETSQEQKTLDSLVDIRFYIPNVAADGGEESWSSETFYNRLKAAMDGLGGVGKKAIGVFQELVFLVPRGRYSATLHPVSIQLMGKSYDYKIPYSGIKRVFYVPKQDRKHMIACIELRKPLRQGQTNYGFLVIQFGMEEKVERESLAGIADLCKLDASPEVDIGGAVTRSIGKMAECPIIGPGSMMVFEDQCWVECSVGAIEGCLYFLDAGLLLVPKPAMYVVYSDITRVIFSRIESSGIKSRTFDIVVSIYGGGSKMFSGIQKEYYMAICSVLDAKGVKYNVEKEPDGPKYAEKRILDDEEDISEDEDDPTYSEEESTD